MPAKSSPRPHAKDQQPVAKKRKSCKTHDASRRRLVPDDESGTDVPEVRCGICQNQTVACSSEGGVDHGRLCCSACSAFLDASSYTFEELSTFMKKSKANREQVMENINSMQKNQDLDPDDRPFPLEQLYLEERNISTVEERFGLESRQNFKDNRGCWPEDIGAKQIAVKNRTGEFAKYVVKDLAMEPMLVVRTERTLVHATPVLTRAGHVYPSQAQDNFDQLCKRRQQSFGQDPGSKYMLKKREYPVYSEEQLSEMVQQHRFKMKKQEGTGGIASLLHSSPSAAGNRRTSSASSPAPKPAERVLALEDVNKRDPSDVEAGAETGDSDSSDHDDDGVSTATGADPKWEKARVKPVGYWLHALQPSFAWENKPQFSKQLTFAEECVRKNLSDPGEAVNAGRLQVVIAKLNEIVDFVDMARSRGITSKACGFPNPATAPPPKCRKSEIPLQKLEK